MTDRRPRPGLGRGLNALLGDFARDEAETAKEGHNTSGVRMIPVSSIAPHPGTDRACRLDRRARADPADHRPSARA